MNKLDFLSLFENLNSNNYLTNLNNFNGQKLETKISNFYKLLNNIYQQYTESNLRLFRQDNQKAFIIDINNDIFIDENYDISFINEIKTLITNIKNKEKVINVEDYSLTQNMHNTKKNYSYLLYLTTNLNIPEIIFFNNNLIEYNKNIITDNHQNLIIIENLENFFRYKEFINLDIFDYIPNLNKSIIILGNGNQITNSNLTTFINQFDNIHCFFDYDKGGFDMYENIKHINKFFYIPKKEILKNIINIIDKNNKLINKETDVFTNISKNKEYIKIYNDIINKKSNNTFIKIEQEILLHKDIK